MPATWRKRLLCRVFAPVDIASLAFLRVAFGLVMLWEVGRYFYHGWIDRYFVDVTFHFTYFGFEWVRPLPPAGMYWLFWMLGVLAVCIAVGAFYRLMTILFFVGFSYFFLIEAARYLNHLYLVCLLSLVMAVIPVHRALAVDTWVRPSLRSGAAPAWALWLVRFQIAVPYVFGGIAKLNGDWLQGEPVRLWLSRRTDMPLIGAVATEEWFVSFIAYGGLLLDLLVVPALLWSRTRFWAFVLAAGFHVANSQLFQIGIFPWLMIAATLIFFPPDWPRRVLAVAGDRLRRLLPPPPALAPVESGSVGQPLTLGRRLVLVFLAAFCAYQVLMPLRHWVYPGDVAWNEEGHRFSWRMKLRDKSESLTYVVTSPSAGQTWLVRPGQYVTSWQYNGMDGLPEMTLQLAHHIAADFRARGYPDVEVRAEALVSLNGRPRQRLIDPSVNLAAVRRTIWPSDWLLPLTTPLPTRLPRSEP